MATTDKKLPFDLVTSGIRTLAKSSKKYAGYVKQDRAITDGLVPFLKKAKSHKESYQGYKAVVQSLFESGFLNTSDRDFNVEQMFNYIYGVKCVSALPSLLTLHKWLMDNDYTDHFGIEEPSCLYKHQDVMKCFDCNKTFPAEQTTCSTCKTAVGKKVFNTSGDNYFSAYEFDYALTEIDRDVMNISSKTLGKKIDDEDRPQAKTRVVIAENQSPMWAFVIVDSPYTGEPDTLFIVRLKCNYNDPCRLQALLDMAEKNTLENNYKWSTSNDTSRYGIIAAVDIKNLECKMVLQPKHIESALFNVYSGHTCIEVKGEE